MSLAHGQQSPIQSTENTPEEYHDDIIYPGAVPFVIVHLICLGAIWTGISRTALILCVSLYVARMFGATAGYHRYFSHRTYKTSRVFQFMLALLAQSSAQRGALWWASKHRHHHKHSDTESDIHSPRQRGFFHAHLGWIFNTAVGPTDYDAIPDLTKYPELVWLNEHQYFPATLLGIACFVIGGWSGLIVGFFWSTVILYHCTFFINSLAHVHGNQRYVTGDDSRNNWWLAVITLGEGWHNNHHAYQRSTRQGFRWYEFDPTFYVLKVFQWMGLVWDLGEPPVELVRNEQKLGRAVIEKVARELAASFPTEPIVSRISDVWARASELEQSRAAVIGRASAEDLRAKWRDGLHAAQLPTASEIRARAEAMFASTPSIDDIVARAREIIANSVAAQLPQAAA